MKKNDTFDLFRVINAIETCPESDIFIISGNLKSSTLFEERILEYVKPKKRIRKITNHPYSMDGINFMGSIVLLCGYWWQNKNTVNFIENFSTFSKLVIPVTHIPTVEGGEKSE